jgi:hypothetical protein
LCRQGAAHGSRIPIESLRPAETVQSHLRGPVRMGRIPVFMDAKITRIIAGVRNRHPDVIFEQSDRDPAAVSSGASGGSMRPWILRHETAVIWRR